MTPNMPDYTQFNHLKDHQMNERTNKFLPGASSTTLEESFDPMDTSDNYYDSLMPQAPGVHQHVCLFEVYLLVDSLNTFNFIVSHSSLVFIYYGQSVSLI